MSEPDLMYEEPEEPEEPTKKPKKPKKPKRSRKSIDKKIEEKDDQTFEDMLEKIEKTAGSNTTGSTAVLQRIINGEEVSSKEHQNAWKLLGANLKAVNKAMTKLTTTCGGSLVFFYAPPAVLGKADGNGDDKNMYEHSRSICSTTHVGAEEFEEYFDIDHLDALTNKFTEKQKSFFLHGVDESDSDDRIRLADFADDLGIGDLEGGGDEIFNNLAPINEVGDPLLPPRKKQATDRVATPSEFAVVERKELSAEENIKVTKILSLQGNDASDHVMCKSIPKPDWVTYGAKPYTEKKHAFTPDESQSTYRIQTTCLQTFMLNGYWYNMGCSDLNNFFDWLALNMATKDAILEFKKKMGMCKGYSNRYFSQSAYPILLRIFFNYTSEYTNMEEVNDAFREFLC